jgi:hypothetical protein
MWKNIVHPGRAEMTTWPMRIACWIPKAADTHSEYITLIAFPLQQWLLERASLLRYTHIASLVLIADTRLTFILLMWRIR